MGWLVPGSRGQRRHRIGLLARWGADAATLAEDMEHSPAEGSGQQRAGQDADDRLLAQGMAVRPVRGGIRITIRTNEEDERLLNALASSHGL